MPHHALPCQVAPAPASDSATYLTSEIVRHLADGVLFLGNHAFHNLPGVMPGFSQACTAHMSTMNKVIAKRMVDF